MFNGNRMLKPETFSKVSILKNPRQFAQNSNKSDLLKALKYLDYKYHTKNQKLVEDEIYDILKDVYAERFPQSKYLQKTGAPVGKGKVGKGQKKRLPYYMSSLAKLKPGQQQLTAWLKLNKGPYVVSDKLDGISIQLVYKQGKLVEAYTRGDGKIGKDISAIIPGLHVPKTIKAGDVAIRAEGIIKHKVFKRRYSKESGGQFVDSRNMVGGLLNSNVPQKELVDVQIIAHSILGGEKAGQPFSQQYAFLKKLGFDVVLHKRFDTLNEEKLIHIYNSRRSKSHNLLDGIVISLDKSYRLPTDGHPDYAKAFKINSEEDMREAVVEEVEWEISRHNKIVPTIRIKPITLGRVTVTNFHGFNAYFIMNGIRLKDRNKGLKKLPIGPGSRLRVIRSGDVIPYIDTVLTASKTGKPQMPSIPYELTGDNDSEAYALDNSTNTQQVKRITYFFSTIGCEGMKMQTVTKLIAAGYDSVESILKLTADDFNTLPGFSNRSGVKLYANLHKALSELTFAKLGAASSIFGEGVSAKTLQKIYEEYPSIMGMVKLPLSELTAKISGIHGIKEKANDIAKALPKFVRFVQKNGLVIQAPTKVKVVGNSMVGKVCLFTGIRDKELEQTIRKQGGTVAGSFGSEVNLLIVKDLSFTSSKVEKAKAKGVQVIAIDKLRHRL